MRWVQFGCFTPLMHAHGRMPQEPWHYSERVLDAVPRLRAAARAARPVRARGGRDRGAHRPADHPAAVPDRPGATRAGGRSPTRTATGRRCGSRRCSTTARASARCALPRGRVDRDLVAASRVRGGGGGGRRGAACTGSRCGCARARSSSPTRPSTSRAGSATSPESERPLVATLWGEPALGRAERAARRRDAGALAPRRVVGLARARDRVPGGRLAIAEPRPPTAVPDADGTGAPATRAPRPADRLRAARSARTGAAAAAAPTSSTSRAAPSATGRAARG